MPAARSLLTASVVAVFAAACAHDVRPTPTVVVSEAPRPPMPKPKPPLPKGGCGDGRVALPARGGSGPPVFGEAHRRLQSSSAWGAGFRAIELPLGFVRVTKLPPVGHEQHEYEHMLAADDRDPAPIHAWGFQNEAESDPYAAAVQVYRLSMPAARPPSLFLHLVHAANHGDVPEDATAEDIAKWFNHVSEFTDDKGRRNVEWSYVEKGCLRWEAYERFVEVGRDLYWIRVVVESSIDDATLADWLARFFDAPLGLPMAAGRRALRGEGSLR
jgi:hypothetical protein